MPGGRWRCYSRAKIGGKCVKHFLDHCRWEWAAGPLRVSIDLSAFNRLAVHVDEDRPRQWVALDFGNDGSDPAVSIVLDRSRR